MDTVHRGHLYVFDKGKGGEKRVVLAIGSERRATDRMVSILMLGDIGIGHDVVKLSVPGRQIPFYAHCGMITYTARTNLVEDIGVVPEAKMAKIDRIMASELDLLGDIVEKARFYENAYKEVLDKLIEVGNKPSKE